MRNIKSSFDKICQTIKSLDLNVFGYASDFPHVIERSRFNRRRGQLFPILEKVRRSLARHFPEFEEYFIVDSMPLEVCRITREKRAKVCKESFDTSPAKGFCASQNLHFFEYKLQGICVANGISHSVELTRANVHDTTFLKEFNRSINNLKVALTY